MIYVCFIFYFVFLIVYNIYDCSLEMMNNKIFDQVKYDEIYFNIRLYYDSETSIYILKIEYVFFFFS
jgi:hypothetical protein